MKGALDVHRDLLTRDVPHEVVRLRRRVTCADDLPGVLGLDRGCVSVRCYVVERSQGRSFVAALVRSGELPSPSRLLDVLDAWTVRPATAAEVNAATDYAASLVCPVGLPGDVEIVADSALATADTSYCALGEGGVALSIRTLDLLHTTGARTAVLTGGPTPPPARVLDLDQAVPVPSPGEQRRGGTPVRGAFAVERAVRSGDVL